MDAKHSHDHEDLADVRAVEKLKEGPDKNYFSAEEITAMFAKAPPARYRRTSRKEAGSSRRSR